MDIIAKNSTQKHGYAQQGAICPCCGASNSILLGRLPTAFHFCDKAFSEPVNPGNLYSCRVCALWYRFPCLSEIELDLLYKNAAGSSWSDAPRARSDEDDIVSKVESLKLPSKLKALDVGCSTGNLLNKIASMTGISQIELHGIEPSSEACEIAKSRGINIVGASYRNLADFQNTFDLIISVDVFEHITHPLENMRLLVNALRPGGYILLVSGATDSSAFARNRSDFCYAAMPEHVIFFNQKNISWMAQQVDARLVDYEIKRYLPNIGITTTRLRNSVHAITRLFPDFIAKHFMTPRFLRWRGQGFLGQPMDNDSALVLITKTR